MSILVVAVWLIVAAVGWVLCRFGAASVPAVLFCVTAATLLVVGYGTKILFGDPAERIVGILEAGAFVSYFVGGATFFVASIKNRIRCVGNCAGFMIVFFSFVIAATSAYTEQNFRKMPEAVQETRQMLLTLHRLTMDIEAIHAKTGRYPIDEAELVALRGKPMPTCPQAYHIRYDCPSKNDYRMRGEFHLECMPQDFWGRHWDFGWIFHFYGRDAAQRVYVETF